MSGFAECQTADTRQSLILCRVSPVLTLGKDSSIAQCRCFWHSAKPPPLSSVGSLTLGKGSSVAECRHSLWHSAKAPPLLSVVALTLGKSSLSSAVTLTLGKVSVFAECHGHCTRQIYRIFFSFFFSFILTMHIHSQITYIHIYIFTDHIYITNSHISITYITKVHINPQVHHPSINKST